MVTSGLTHHDVVDITRRVADDVSKAERNEGIFLMPEKRALFEVELHQAICKHLNDNSLFIADMPIGTVKYGLRNAHIADLAEAVRQYAKSRYPMALFVSNAVFNGGLALDETPWD